MEITGKNGYWSSYAQIGFKVADVVGESYAFFNNTYCYASMILNYTMNYDSKLHDMNNIRCKTLNGTVKIRKDIDVLVHSHIV